MPPRRLRPSIEERALRSEQRMGLGTVSGRVESASPVRGVRGQSGARVPSVTLGGQGDKAISDDLTLSDGAAGSETWIFTTPPSWLSAGKIVSSGLYQASVAVGADASITDPGQHFEITFLPSGVAAFNPSVLFLPSNVASNNMSNGAFILGVWPFGPSDVPVVIETFTYQNFAGEDVIVNLILQRLAW